MSFTLDELNEATAIVREAMLPTPQYRWPQLSDLAGCQIWVKHENHTPTGAFKVRGGLVYMNELARSGGHPELITATRGNHGQSIAYAAARYGVPVTVLVPEGNSLEKNAAMRAWGARVETFGADFDVARVEAGRRAEQMGLTLVPSFHPALVRGVATYALELFEAVADLDVVYVPIGMGSGICGVIRVRDLLGLRTEVVGVVSTQAPAMALSVAAGRIIETNSANTFADGVACRVPMPAAFDAISQGAARIVQVSENEVAQAMRLYYRATHNIAEGAGAAGLAAVFQERDCLKGRKVATILSGGNVDRALFAGVLNGITPDIGGNL